MSIANFAEHLVGILTQPSAILDCSGAVVAYNTAFVERMPDTMGEMLGVRLAEVLEACGGSSIQQALPSVQAALVGADSKSAKLSVELPSGRHRLSLDRLMTDEDSVLTLCQLRSDAPLDSSRLTYLLEHLEQGVWRYDVRLQTLSVTPAWCRLRGKPIVHELSGQSAEDRDWWLFDTHPDDHRHLKDAVRALVGGDEESLDLQYRYKTSETTWKWIQCRVRAMSRDENGQARQLVGMDTDISAFKDVEVSQLELSSKLQLAIGVSGIGVWEFDSATSKVFWDDALLKIYGVQGGENWRPDDVWETFLHPDDREATVAAADRALAERRDLHADYRIIRQDGEIRYLRSAARFIGGSGSSGKMLGVNIDVTEDYERTAELERARELLEHDSRHDALTGLANRRMLDEYTKEMLERLGPQDDFAVLHIDLDHFKKVNDTLGHAAGDQVLTRVAETLRGLVGDAGLACRNGGDEFVVLLEKFDGERALRALCQSMIDEMAAPMIMKGQVRSVGLSIGCAIANGGVEDAGEVFINADVALYAAKSAGRSCFKMFCSRQRSVSPNDVATYHDLAGAMDAGHLSCHFQPQFDGETLAVVGAEALVRWDCPVRGLVMPDEFLPAAQSTGLCARVDEYVLDCVLAAQDRWAQAGLAVPTVALNISLPRLMQPDLIEQVTGKLKSHHAISFELLETSFLDQRTDALDAVLRKVRKAGIRIDLDDFGSGHSSILALQSVKPDRVKLDRMLISPLAENPAQIHILSALVRVARLVECGVVIEGIETQAQLDAVADLHCEAVQGYFLGRPVPEDEFVATLPPAIDGARRIMRA